MSFERVTIERTVKVKRFKNVRCDGCGDALREVSFGLPEDPEGLWEGLQADNALIVELRGGYGMRIDPFHGIDPLLFCSACAIKLEDQWPAIKKALEPEPFE